MHCRYAKYIDHSLKVAFLYLSQASKRFTRFALNYDTLFLQ